MGRGRVMVVLYLNSTVLYPSLLPRPIGGIYLKHAANVIVHFKDFKTSGIPSFKATLIKHQYTKTPKSAALYIRKVGGMMLLD